MEVNGCLPPLLMFGANSTSFHSIKNGTVWTEQGGGFRLHRLTGLRPVDRFLRFLVRTGKNGLKGISNKPVRVKKKIYPATLWLCYRGIHYRPAALQLFVERGGWGEIKEEHHSNWLCHDAPRLGKTE